MPGLDAEIEHLDQQIREHDERATIADRCDAAELLWDKALLLEERAGPTAGIPVFREIVARLEGLRDPVANSIYVSALNSLAALLQVTEDNDGARRVAGQVVRDHLHTGPLEAGVAIANAVIIWTRFEWLFGDREKVVPVLEDTLARYGREPCPDPDWVQALLTLEIGKRKDERGEKSTAVALYRQVAERYARATDVRMRDVVGEATMRLAHAIWHDDLDEAIELCRVLVQDFDSPDLPDLAPRIDWARTALMKVELHQAHQHRRRRRWRRN